MGNNNRKTPAASKCRDCGTSARIPRHEFYKAARPRCPACGGMMEYQGGPLPDGVKHVRAARIGQVNGRKHPNENPE